jgi:transposase-like protein
MSQRKVSQAEREQIYLKKQAGETLPEIAQALGLSEACVRKWWRRARDEGLLGLVERPRGRPAQGVLSTFSADVQQRSLQLKRTHKRWGANRVRLEMVNDPALADLPLPSRSRLYVFFRQHCPDCLSVWTKHIQLPIPAMARAVHEVWQMDHQEGHHLGDESIATVCNIRDPFGAAMISSQAFSVKTKQRWRKLTWEEARQVLRAGFTEWQTLPDSVLTDNEMGLGGNPNDPFPSWLSLYLAGLGIKHNFIRSHQPTDQPQVERNHRTLDGFTQDEHSRQDLDCFQQALDHERSLYNHLFPARASDCHGLPPLQAHPALLQPRRPYRPEWEALLFDLQRVYDFLASFTFERKINRNGQVTLKGQPYTVGLVHQGKRIQVRLDAQTQEWRFLERDEQGQEQELSRRALVGIDFKSLTGFDPPDGLSALPAIQLTLPLGV